MINAFKELTTYDKEDWEQFIDRIGLSDVFGDLIQKYKDRPGLLKSIVRYIVWAYSADSDKIILGSDWLQNKKNIYEAADLPLNEDAQKDVVFLENVVLLQAIKKWLEYQQNDTWTEICMLKDLRVEMQTSANSRILKASGECDFDQKFKNAKYSIELYNMIKDAESKLLQNDPKMKEAYREVKRASKDRVTIGPESYAK